jgi:hypothetical protein
MDSVLMIFVLGNALNRIRCCACVIAELTRLLMWKMVRGVESFSVEKYRMVHLDIL